MKKIVCLTVVLLFITMVFGFASVSAADDALAITVESLALDKADAKTTLGYYNIEVPVVITENTGFMAVKLSVEYDDALQFTGWKEGTVFPNVDGENTANQTSTKSEDLAKNPFTVYYVDAYGEDNTSTGTLITLKFKVAEDVAAGDYKVNATLVEAFSQKGNVGADVETDLPTDITSATTVVNGNIKVSDTSDVFKITADTVNVNKKDGKASVAITLENNPGIKNLKFTVDFDATALKYTGVTYGEIFAESEVTLGTDNVAAGTLAVDATAAANKTADGKLITLEFDLAEEATVGEYAIDIEAIGELDAMLKDGAVNINDGIPGDVNGDGKVTRPDLIRLTQYFANWAVEIDTVGADTNGDGKVTRPDLIRLTQYFANWSVQLGK